MSLANLPRKVRMGIAAVVATAFFVLMSLALIATPGLDGTGVGGAEDFGRLADSIFVTNVLALEILGVLLTAVLIGAMVIARPLGSTPDSVNYQIKASGAKLAEVQLVSDIDRNMGDGGFATPDALQFDDGGEEE